MISPANDRRPAQPNDWAARLYWPAWALATAMTGIVAGFMLGHALLLGRFLDWLLVSGRAAVLATTYAAWRGGAGAVALAVYCALAGLQVLAVLTFGIVSVVSNRCRARGIAVAIGGTLWLLVHYGSGFAALETAVLRSTVEVPRELAARFVEWNVRVHALHAATLLVTLGVLLSIALSARRSRRASSRDAEGAA